MLNACRRQRSVHKPSSDGNTAFLDVLNACRRQRSVHRGDGGFAAHGGEVLNACRRQRSVHEPYCLMVPASEKCSTPVGVKDRFTCSRSRLLFVADSCAQRLSASKIGSPCKGFDVDFVRRVLNACRRQRSVHEGSRDHLTLRSWVLNACRRQRSVHILSAFGFSSNPGCAQRLSASKIGSPSRQTNIQGLAGVLNACRRQRSVHQGAFVGFVISYCVLNACRRQRSVHLRRSSAPFVILFVLNACRRQRSVH